MNKYKIVSLYAYFYVMELSYLNHEIRTGKPQSTVFMNFGIVSISDNWNIIQLISL